jgi:hypothetical protein
MAITTMDGLIAAMPGQHIHVFRNFVVGAKAVGTWQSHWGSTSFQGNPGTAVYPSASTAWVVPTAATSGALPFTNPGAGFSYLGRMTASAFVVCNWTLYDRLAHTGAITPAASTQALTTTPLTRPDALGDDVEIWFEWITASGATTSNLSCSYTNQAGTAGRTTQLLTGQTTSTVGQMQPFRLATGDTGVRSVESFTGTGAIGGTGMLVLLRRIADISVVVSYLSMSIDPFTTGMPRIYDDACLATMHHASTTNGLIGNLSFQIVQG